MFTIFRACNQESVYNLVEPPNEMPACGPPLYKSVYSCKVREDHWKVRNKKMNALCKKVCEPKERTCLSSTRLPPIPPCKKFGVVPTCCQDFIKLNVVKAVRQVARKPAMRLVDDRVGNVKNWCSSGLPRVFVFGENFGKIPCYLDDIKQELYCQDQKAKAQMKSKEGNMQQSCRHLDPIEREAILCGLKKNWEEIFRQFQSLPLLIDNVGKINKKSDFEKQLKSLEKDIQLIERHDHIFVADTCNSFYLA